MKVTLLQDHTEFMERMIACAYDHNHGLPLSVTALNSIRVKTVVGRYQKKLYTLEHLRELAEWVHTPATERRKLAKIMAAAVEGDIEGWYCIRDDEGADWLRNNYVGPVLDWAGAVWWCKLKNLELDIEVDYDKHFKQRKRSESGRREAAPASTNNHTRVPSSSGLFRPDVEAIE